MSVVQLRDAADWRTYGGKAASLAQLASQGLPVPNGFCISSGTAVCLTPQVLDEIKDHLRNLGSTHVAVRSSASAEDSQASSLAGIFRSELGVSATAPNVARAISKVVQSVSNAAILPYLEPLGIHSGIRMAVLVQAMLQPRITGVLFTCDPITERPDICYRDLAKRRCGRSGGPRFSRANRSGTRQSSTILRPTDRTISGANFPSLDAHTTHTLVNLALKCEGILGPRQDIEWAVDKSSIWILQSRPITGLLRKAE